MDTDELKRIKEQYRFGLIRDLVDEIEQLRTDNEILQVENLRLRKQLITSLERNS